MEGETPELLVRNKQLDGGPVQILSLPGHVLQSAHVASRLIGVAPRNGDAASVRDAVIRWRHARARGLSASDAPEALGVSRATLHRRENRPDPAPHAYVAQGR